MCIHAYMGYTYSPYKVSDVGSVQISCPTFFSLESIMHRYPPKIIPLASRTNVSLSFSCIRPPRRCYGLTKSERCLTLSGSSPSKRPVLPDYLHPQQPTTAERPPESLILTKQSPLFSLLSPLPSSRSLTSGAMLPAYPFPPELGVQHLRDPELIKTNQLSRSSQPAQLSAQSLHVLTIWQRPRSSHLLGPVAIVYDRTRRRARLLDQARTPPSVVSAL